MASLAQVLKPLDPSGALPLYQQLQRALREAIESHVLAPEDALPAERQIAAELSVSRITVRKAIDGLVGEGLLVRRQGSGNFVCSRIEKNFAKLTSFSEDMRARGRNPRSEWLRRAAGAVTPEEALTLRPMCLEYATIAADALPALDSVGSSLYDALEAAGNRPTRALQRLRALLLNTEQAKLLHAREGDAGLLVERVGFLRDGRAVEFCQSYFRGDTYDFVAELAVE